MLNEFLKWKNVVDFCTFSSPQNWTSILIIMDFHLQVPLVTMLGERKHVSKRRGKSEISMKHLSHSGRFLMHVTKTQKAVKAQHGWWWNRVSLARGFCPQTPESPMGLGSCYGNTFACTKASNSNQIEDFCVAPCKLAPTLRLIGCMMPSGL